MVIQIGALKSGRDADVQADIAAVVEVAHAAGAIVKVIFENAYLTDDEKIRACRLTEAAGARLREDLDRLRAERRDPRRPPADARQHLAAHRGQGRRRRPDARRAARGHGPGRDADRRDRRRSRSSTTSGRARPGRPRSASAAGIDAVRATDGRPSRPVGIGMLGSGFIGEFHADGLRYIPDARVVANWGAGTERREAFAKRFGSRALESIDAVCADPEVDLVIVSLPNHLHLEAVRVRGRPRQGRRLHEAARPERNRGGRDAAARRGRRRLPCLPRERRLRHRDGPDARDGRGRRDRPADHVPRPRGPQRPARRALLGRRAGRRRGAAGHGVAWRRGCSLHLRQGRRGPRPSSPGARPSSTATGRPARTTPS